MAYSQQLWDEAKRKCKLGEEEIRMAKEMGLNPKSLIMILSILVYTFFSRMFDLMLHPAMNHSTAVA